MKCPQCEFQLNKFELPSGSFMLQCPRCWFQVKTPQLNSEEEIEEWLKKWIDDCRIKEKENSINILGKDCPNVVKKVLGYGKMIYHRIEEPETPSFGGYLDEVAKELNLPSGLIKEFNQRGIQRVYSYQLEAAREIANGKNTLIIAPTGSGKTEAFFMGLVNRIKPKEEGINALLIYPTKALGRDQLRKLYRYATASGYTIKVFEGDTPTEERRAILKSPPNILITNMDTLHFQMAFGHKLSEYLKNVELVVVDELHVYTGTFGSHVYYVFKRLEMLSKHKIQVVAASATVANPHEFAKELFSRDFVVVKCDRGVHGKRYILIMEPLFTSWYNAIVNTLSNMTDEKTIIFANSQQVSERLAYMARKRSLPVGVHRAGLLPEFRKKTESDFRTGILSAVVATSTLELGLDIGDVSAVISEPVDIMSFYQRIGRAGRRGQPSVGVLMLRPDSPISQYYSIHPEDYFTDLPSLYIEPNNPLVIAAQVAAIAESMPLDDTCLDPSLIATAIHKGAIERRGRWYVATQKGTELIRKGIRNIGDQIKIFESLTKKKIGERGLPIALEELYPGARYFHGGKKYLVMDLDMEHKRALVQEVEDDIITKPISVLRVVVKEKQLEKQVFGLQTSYGKIEIEETITGVLKQGKIEALENPVSYKYETLGFVFTAPPPSKNHAGAYHATEHVLIESSDTLTGFSSKDVGGISMGTSGTIFVHDGVPGGNGGSHVLYNRLEEAFKRAYTIVKTCRCRNGCPRCIQSYRCGNNNMPLSKQGAFEVLEKILKSEEAKLDLSVMEGIR
ncbi:MAG: DEAD/DEAH box helicase [Candidatus Korarchaeota archaeon]